MSVAVSRSEGVTVLTLTSDPSSVCPPFCQLLGALCYSPRLCSVSRRLTPQPVGPQTVLGALWIISGLLHLGLGLLLICTWVISVYELRETYSPVWMGLLFMFFGVCCVLTERRPRPVWALLRGILNLAGVALSISAIVFCANGLYRVGFYELCSSNRWDYWGRRTTTPAPPPDQALLLERCQEARFLLRSLSIGVCVTLITLSVLDICLGLSSSILSFKSLKREAKASSQ